jgi:hypothetical protein
VLSTVLGVTPPGTDDETFVTTWVDMMCRVIGDKPRTRGTSASTAV